MGREFQRNAAASSPDANAGVNRQGTMRRLAAAVSLAAVLAVGVFYWAAYSRVTRTSNQDGSVQPENARESVSLGRTSSSPDPRSALQPDNPSRGLVTDAPNLDSAAPLPVIPGSGFFVPDDDPRADGWSVEAFSEQASDQLKRLGELFVDPAMIDAATLSSLASPDFHCRWLQPAVTVKTFEDSDFLVYRMGDDTTIIGANPHRGVSGLANALRDLSRPFLDARDVRVDFKVFRVSTAAIPACEAYFRLTGHVRDTTVQTSATWICQWTDSSDDDRDRGAAPLLRAIDVKDYEQVVSNTPSGPLFADCTDSVLGGTDAYRQQLTWGVDHWLGKIEQRTGIDIGGWQGIAIGDVNGDGLDDLYVCQPGGLPNRLFVQSADGTATEQAAQRGVDFLDSTHGALLIDLDNDADQDLLLSVADGLLMLANDGTGMYSLRDAKLFPAAMAYSLTAADYDHDGDLDVFVCCYNRREGAGEHIVFARPMPYHDANNGGRNVLLRNDGDWKFVHATKQAGLDENNRRFSYAAAWDDYDSDGDLDLYVANDFGRNNLYRNDKGRFRDVAAEAGVEDVGPGMSVSWGDYNNDGWTDLYVSNMFSSAGNRIAYQAGFHAAADKRTLDDYRRHARGNTLFRNQGGGEFKDVSIASGVTVGRWAWGSRFADLNNDGWEDLVVTNGFITQHDPADL